VRGGGGRGGAARSFADVPGLDAWLVSAYDLVCGGLRKRAETADAAADTVRQQLQAPQASVQRVKAQRGIPRLTRLPAALSMVVDAHL
jgi:hypothetical protein